MNKLSVTIITYNEEKNIKRCLQSVAWADEIIVVDSLSTDKTKQICQSFSNVKFIEHPWLGFGKQKHYAVDMASNDWILSVDADEEITLDLAAKIEKIIKKPKYDSYRINRKSFYLNKLIKFCGWNRDYPLRLFNRSKGNFNLKPVHESVEINGTCGRIKKHMLHYTYPTISSHVLKMDKYSALAKNKKSSITKALFSGFFKFIKMYFFKLGFLDGKAGFILCFNSGFGVWLKYIKLWEKNI